MQLTRQDRRRLGGTGKIGRSLAAATCTLLGTSAAGPAIAQDLGDWQFNSAALYYGESDGRVQDMSVNILARGQLDEDNVLNLGFTYDTLSGASPNGAAPSNSAQIFARPITLTRSSGGGVNASGGNFEIAPGALPIDDSFQDQRFAGNASWERRLGRMNLLNLGASASFEYDYTHLGVNTGIARDFNNRNTTLSTGIAWSDDKVKPAGGAPLPFSPMVAADTSGAGQQEDFGEGRSNLSKHVFDVLFGVTQVLDRRTIMQLNYSLSSSDGYLTDPYKLVSVVDPVTGDLVAGPDPGLNLYRYENRPDSRKKKSLFGLVKHDFNGNVLDASYRVMSDDWGIDSRTFDLHFRWNFGDNRYVQPHVRFYSQTAADFYHTVLFAGEPLPEFATGDYRLGKFDAVTLGLKFGRRMGDSEFSTRVEVYRQSGNASPGASVGSLGDVNLYPDLTAIVVQISFKFDP